jgi:hypothetical protein
MLVVAVVAHRAEAIDVLAGVRERFYGCSTRRADAFFELADALLCADGPVKTLVRLSRGGNKQLKRAFFPRRVRGPCRPGQPRLLRELKANATTPH